MQSMEKLFSFYSIFDNFKCARSRLFDENMQLWIELVGEGDGEKIEGKE